MKTAAAYIRVSTEDQTELSPDSQLKLIRDYAKKNGYILPEEFVYHDDGISGRTTAKRPGFNKMIGTAKMKPRPFDAILVWKFSRFARNREDSIVYKSMLRKLGIDVISISENVGDDKMSVLIEAMIEAMDEYYSINLSEEVRRGMIEKLSRGKIVVAPPIGYTLEDGKYVPDENAPLVKRIFDMFANQGIKMRQIAVTLNNEGYTTKNGNTFSNRTIDYILRNPTYIGKLRWTLNGDGSSAQFKHEDDEAMIVDGEHEPIVEIETWNKAQDRAEEVKRKYPKYARDSAVKNDHMLRGLVRCSNCGGTLIYNPATVGLQCCNYSRGNCNKSHYISAVKIVDIVLDELNKMAVDMPDVQIDYRSTAPDKSQDDDLAKNLIKKEYAKLDRVKQAYMAGIDTIEEYKANKENIMSRIKELESKAPKQRTISKEDLRQELKQKIAQFLENYNSMTDDAKNSSLREFVSKIIFDRSKSSVTIFYYV